MESDNDAAGTRDACRRCRARLAGHGRRTRRDRRAVQIQRRGLRPTRRGSGITPGGRNQTRRAGEGCQRIDRRSHRAGRHHILVDGWRGRVERPHRRHDRLQPAVFGRDVSEPAGDAAVPLDVSDSSGAARLAVVSRRTRVGCADYRGRLEPSPAGNGRWQYPPARGAAVGGGGVPCDRDQRQSRTASGTFCRPTHLLRSPPALRPRGVGPGCVLCGAR